MNQGQLVAKVAKRISRPQQVVIDVIRGVTQAITEELSDGGKVSIAKLGIFEARAYRSRIARNPKTGVIFEAPAGVRPRFKPSEALKDAVSAGEPHVAE